MKTCVGNFGDITAATKLCKRLHAQSSWKQLEFNSQHVRKQMMNMVRTDGMDMLLAKDDGHQPVGILLATVDQRHGEEPFGLVVRFDGMRSDEPAD